MSDPNWLLSATAQSAAALVAIIGGFLITRVMTLSSQREGFRHLADELEARVSHAEDTYGLVKRERVEVGQQWFFDHSIGDIVAARGVVDIDRAVEDFLPIGCSLEEIAPFARNLMEAVRRAFAEIEAVFPTGMPPDDVSGLVAAGVSNARMAPDLYEEVASEIASQRTKKVEQRFGMLSSAFLADLPSLGDSIGEEGRVADQRERIRIEAERLAELRRLRVELDVAKNGLARIGTPKGVGGAAAALAYLTAVGVVAPLILMALRPVPDGPWWRALVVGGFVSGIVVVGAALWRAVGRLVGEAQTLDPLDPNYREA